MVTLCRSERQGVVLQGCHHFDYSGIGVGVVVVAGGYLLHDVGNRALVAAFYSEFRLILFPYSLDVFVGDSDVFVGNRCRGNHNDVDVAYGFTVVDGLGVDVVGSIESVDEHGVELLAQTVFHVVFDTSPDGQVALGFFGGNLVFLRGFEAFEYGGDVLGHAGFVVSGSEAECLTEAADKLLYFAIVYHCLREFAVGNVDSEVFVFFVEEFLNKQAVEVLLVDLVGISLAFTLLFAESVEVVEFDLGAVGFDHFVAGAKVGAARGEEVTKDKSEQCHDDNHEENH